MRTCLLLLCFALSGAATGQGTITLTQRQINEAVAPLEKVRRLLIEDTHLRGANEPIAAYVARLVQMQAGETPVQRQERIGGYLAALSQAADATKSLRRVPALCNSDADNLRIWKSITQELTILPARVVRLQAAWRNEQKGAPSHFDTELLRTLLVLIAAKDHLRDARP